MRRSLGGAREKRRDGGRERERKGVGGGKAREGGGQSALESQRERGREREREVVERSEKIQERGVSVEVTAQNGEDPVRPASFDRGERGTPSRSLH